MSHPMCKNIYDSADVSTFDGELECSQYQSIADEKNNILERHVSPLELLKVINTPSRAKLLVKLHGDVVNLLICFYLGNPFFNRVARAEDTKGIEDVRR